jgi:pimeloyl-ACP methyl ester carboxylesterase
MGRRALGRSAAAVILVACSCTATAAAGRARVAADSCTARAGDVHFRASDGTRLVGQRFGRGRVAVVLAHENRGWLCDWVPFAKRLAARGYLAFPFDFRGYGESASGGARSARLDLDVAGAVRAVRSLGTKKVFVVGASIGGSAVLAAGATVLPPVAGVVSVSAAADLVGASEAARRLRVPVLYVAGKLDPQFAADARRLYAQTPTRTKRLAIVDRGEHGTDLVDASAGVRSAIEAFIRAH